MYEEAAVASVASPTSPIRPKSQIEGMLARKHEWKSTVNKAPNRSWNKVYAVLADNLLSFYKDQKHAKADPRTFFHNEPQMDLTGAVAVVALDYSKRQHVFRLKQAGGAEYLFQCKDERELNLWISQINADAEDASPTGYATLPPSLEGKRDEPKRRSFLTLGRKIVKDA